MKNRSIFNAAARAEVAAKHPEYGVYEVRQAIAEKTIEDFRRKHGHELDDLKEALAFLDCQDMG